MTERATTPVAPDGFALGERLGSGGCAEVFRATELATGRPVALKFAWPNDGRVGLSLLRERHTLARVAHPSVPRVVAHGEAHGRAWLALTLTEGSTLRAWSRPGGAPRELRELARCFARLCDALAYLHGEGVVHGDLSPDNVLVTDEGAPVLLDYGGAAWPAIVGRREALDAQPRFQGTLAYAAPELLLERDADGRADLYALGCLLFEALTGAPPHAGSPAQVTAGHVWGAGDFAALRSVPEPMRALVTELLSADPGARPPFADAVARALRGIADASPQPAPLALLARASLLRPRLVGRSDERGRLLAWASEESSGFALVFGRAGLGKTRLLREFAFALEAEGRAVCAVGTSPARDGAAPSVSPFGPFVSLLRALDARLDDAAVEDRPMRDDLERLAPFFRDEPNANREQVARSTREALRSDSPRIESALALLRVLSRWLGGGRAFVLLDDLQWADDLTALAIEVELRVGVLREARVSLLLACRPEALPPRLERLVAPEPLRERALRVELLPLDARAVPMLARESLGVAELPAELAAVLAAAAAGSPLLAGELLRLALTRGVLRRSEGRWDLHLSSLNALPTEPDRVLDARIESLPAALAPVLHAAAVLGRDVDRALLASLLASQRRDEDEDRHEGAHSTEAIDDALTALWSASVLEDDRAGRFRFAHDRLRDAALARVPAPARARLHAAAARALEGRPRTEQTHALSARIAGHWLDAGRPREAAPHFERAALEAAQTGALEESCRAYRSLLELAPRVGATGAQRGAWQRALADALSALGRADEARERYADALASWGDRAPASRPAMALAAAVEFAKQLASRALGPYAPRGARQPRDRDMARVLAAQPFLLSDDLVSLYSALRSVNLAERSGADDALALSLGFLSALAFTVPIDAIGEHYFTLAEAALRRGGRAVLDTRTPLVFAYIRAMRAEWPEARRWLDVGLEAAERAGDPRLCEDALSLRCDVELFVGDFETARALAERGLASALRRGDRQTMLWARCDLLRGALLAGHDPGPTLVPLEDNTLTAERTVLVDEVMLLGLRSLARARLSRHDAALADARSALAAASRADGTIFVLMHGCWPAAQTAHESRMLTARERTRLLRTAQEAMERVARYAAAARPRTRLVTAWRWLSEGKPARARDALSRGIAEARAAGLERDATVLLRERDAATNPVAR